MRRLMLAVLLLAGCKVGDGTIGDPNGRPGQPMANDPPAPNGPPPARCTASVVGPRALVRLTAAELDRTLRDIFPEASVDVSLGVSDPLDSKDGFVNPSKLVFGEDSSGKLLEAAGAIAGALVAPDKAAVLGARFACAQGARDAACAASIIDGYGRRLFRRPLTGDEPQRYRALYAEVAGKSDFATGLKWALVALIQSPHTLYRRQIGAPAGGVHRLTQYELASELAFTFTGRAPDEALLDKAARGQLGTREALVNEARALLTSPAGRAAMGEFFRLWLGYDLVIANQRDRVPGFVQVRDKLAAETQAFIDRVVFKESGGLRALLTAPYTTVDPALAGYYGLPAPAPSADLPAGFGVAMRPAGQGVGVLAQGSLLAERSQSLGSSPTKRGITLRQKFLCLSIPPQPAVVPDLPPEGAGWRTTRQRFEDAHARGACASCHRIIDPLGFTLEHFDEAGRYRASENGEPINAKGDALDDSGNVLFSADGQEDLARTLAMRPEVAACVGETLVKYLFAQDRNCLAADARNDFVDGKLGFVDLAANLAAAPHFSERRD